MGFFRKIKDWFGKGKGDGYSVVPHDPVIEAMVRNWVIKKFRGEVFHLTKDGWDATSDCILTWDKDTKQYVFLKNMYLPKNNKPVIFLYRISKETMLHWLRVLNN